MSTDNRTLKDKVNAAYGKAVTDKPVITKSKAAELKDALEARQVGAAPKDLEDTAVTITTGTGKQVKTTLKKMIAASTAQKIGPAGKKFKAALETALGTPERKTLKPKTEQLDMVTEKKLDVPEPTSPLYLAGKRLKEAIVQEELLKDEKAEAQQEVLKAMKKAKRYNYRVEGYLFELAHTGAMDKVKVIKPK